MIGQTSNKAWPYQDEFLVAGHDLIRRVLRSVGLSDFPRLALVGVGWWSNEKYENGPIADADPNMVWRPDPSSWTAKIEKGSSEESDDKSFLLFVTRASARTLALRDVLVDELRRHDAESDTVSRCSGAVRVGSHDCAFVLEFNKSTYNAHQRVDVPHPKGGSKRITVGLIDAVVDALLERLASEAQKGDQGLRGPVAQAEIDLVLRAAARRMLGNVHLAIGRSFTDGDLVDSINAIASLTYEAAEPDGAMILAAEEKAGPFRLKFKNPVPLRAATWARKTFEMAGKGLCVAANGEAILGLIERPAPAAEEFWIRLKGRSRWELGVGATPLAEIRFGLPVAPTRRLRREHFDSTFQRVFKESSSQVRDKIWSLIESLMQQGRGALLVVTEDAVAEAERLSEQATPVEPTEIDGATASRGSAIDGAIILDAVGTCHCVGAILDGEAYFRGTPSRGARFNSAARYVAAKKGVGRLAIVVSDDGYVDMLPRLRPPISASELVDIVDRVLSHPRGENMPAALQQDCLRLVTDYADYLSLFPGIGDEERKKIISGVLGKLDDIQRTPTYDPHETDLIMDIPDEAAEVEAEKGALDVGTTTQAQSDSPDLAQPKAPENA